MPRLKELYFSKIQPELKNKLSLKNKFMGPKLIKVVLNMGLGVDGNDQKILTSCINDLAQISGQKPGQPRRYFGPATGLHSLRRRVDGRHF